MGKLGSKEIFLILIVINFLLYYLGYICVVNPIRNKGKEYSEEIVNLQADYDQKQTTVAGIPQLEQDIEDLKATKKEKLDASYPDGYSEDVQMFAYELTKAKSLNLTEFGITQNPIVNRNEDGEDVPTGVTSNNITIAVSGTYDNILSFISDMETRNAGAKLTSLDWTTRDGNYQATINYLMLTVEKGEDIKDDTFSKNETKFAVEGNDSKLFK
jgi:Tfp pilus assembly protein PilO